LAVVDTVEVGGFPRKVFEINGLAVACGPYTVENPLIWVGNGWWESGLAVASGGFCGYILWF